MHVLVTGAAGFIGSHLTRALLSEGHRVTGLDDLSTGHRRNLPTDPTWRFILGDIRSPELCNAAMEDVDAVVHLAGRNSVPRSLDDPHSALEVNVMGGFHLLQAARHHGVRRFTYASSSSIYGDDPALPKREEQLPRPLSPYAASKGAFEQVARAHGLSFGMHTLGLRFFNVFGARQDPHGPYAAVVPRFVEAALANVPPTIHGTGLQSRDFTHVDNVIHGIRLALEAGDAASGEVVNLAAGGRVTVLALWEAIRDLTGSHADPVFGPSRAGDMPHSHADITRAHQLLGYAPLVSFGDGLRRTVEAYRGQLLEVAP